MKRKLAKVQLTNLDKILYPELGITKAKVIEYYIRMAPKMLGLPSDRPLVLARFPNGVGEEGFYEKDVPIGAPAWVETFKRCSETAKRGINYVVCNDIDTLVWLANLAALELGLWDKGKYDAIAWTENMIKFILRGEKLQGRYVLTRFKKAGEKQWVLLKAAERE